MGLGWTPYQSFIAVLMVVTGSINTLAVKWANTIPARNMIGECVPFNHPFLQSVVMFLGEFMCVGAFYVSMCWTMRRARGNDVEKPLDDKTSVDDNEKEPEPELKPFSMKKAYLLLPAALCDMLGTSTMYVALTLTSASSFQMLRGAVIIFTGVNSMIFLRRRLEWFRWFGMVVIMCGLVIVGLADVIAPAETECYDLPTNGTTLGTTATTTIATTSVVMNTTSHPVVTYLGDDDWTCDTAPVKPLMPVCGDNGSGTIGGIPKEVVGDILVIVAQIIVSIQMVYEEKVLSQYAIAPLQAVGSEGFFGFVLMTICLIAFAFIPTNSIDWGHSSQSPYYLEDAIDGLYQMVHNGLLLFSFLLTAFSIAFFNFAGISVTKELSATTRMVLDSVRTLVIWAFSLAVSWQKFQYLQPIGFVVLLAGMCLYNDLLIRPGIQKCLNKNKS